jgi:hypothetical protein
VGAVKARVIRYDEPVDTSSRFFRFANNVPIFFGLRTTHPDSGSGGGPGGMFTVGSDCYNQIHSVIRGIGEYVRDFGAGSPQFLHHAFMLNHVPYQVHSENVNEWLAYDNCWKYVHENLLKFGVHSESCAQYRWEAGTPEEETGGFSFFGFFASLANKERGNMGVRFVPCDEGFLRGEN